MHEPTRSDDALGAVFAALANPTRRAMLERLSTGQASVTELAAPFDLSQPTISSHLSILESAGLVRRGRVANFRPAILMPVPLQQAHHWTGGFERCWAEGLERLETVARILEKEE
jgi:DNA-binding transcriptional ArsR family regulator